MGDISRVGVVGSGIMGAGIAEVCARAGLDVLVAEVSAEAAGAGHDRVARSLRRAVRAGKLTQAEPRYAPPPLLLRMVDAGLLGKKTGHGFYDYTELAREV
jgi:3-hydroxyacyl-CoA dehydrogenase